MVAQDRIFFEVCYWKNSLLHSLNPQHRFNCLTFQLPNIGIFAFIEQYQKNPSELSSGLSPDEVPCLYHEPPLPSAETVTQLHNHMIHLDHLSLSMDAYKKVYQILFFQVSKRVRLPGLSLESSFFELFNEVKVLFQVYQILSYFCLLYRKVKRSDFESNFRF